MSGYLDRIAVCQASRPDLFQRGEVVHMELAHDSDCPFLGGGGACECVPELVLTVGSGRKFLIDDQGKATEAT